MTTNTDLTTEGYAFRCRNCFQMTEIYPDDAAARAAVRAGEVPPLQEYETGGWWEGHAFDLVRISRLASAAEAAADAHDPDGRQAAADSLTPFLIAGALDAWRRFAREHDLDGADLGQASAFIATYLNRLSGRSAARAAADQRRG